MVQAASVSLPILTTRRLGVRVTPLHFCAGVAEQADARDLKSLGLKGPSRFEPGLRHHTLGPVTVASLLNYFRNSLLNLTSTDSPFTRTGRIQFSWQR